MNLANDLVRDGYVVRVFDLRERPSALDAKVEYVKCDIRNSVAIERACKNVDVIYNLASLLPCSRAGKMFWYVNVGGTANMLSAAVKQRVRRFVHVSSSIVYGIPKGVCTEETPPKPIGDYGRSKLRAEELCQAYFARGLDGVIIRPRFIVGPGRLGLLTILFEWISENKNVYTIGNGKNRFQMIHVADVISACKSARTRGKRGDVFNIGSDHVPPVGKLLQDLVAHAGSRSRVKPLNAMVTQTTLRVLDLFRLTPLNVEHYRIADRDYVLDTSKAKRVLQWKPKYDQLQALSQAYDWYMQHKKALASELTSDLPDQRLLRLVKLFS